MKTTFADRNAKGRELSLRMLRFKCNPIEKTIIIIIINKLEAIKQNLKEFKQTDQSCQRENAKKKIVKTSDAVLT